MLNISLENDPLHMEEHRSRVLEIEGDDAFSARTYLAFLTPLGKRAVSEDLVLTGGRCVYPLSSALLDGAGPLFVQLVAEDDDGRVKKSDVYEFAVSPSLSDGELTAEGGLVCLKDVAADVREILSLLPGFAKKSDLPVVPSAVSAFVNDVPYLTPAELPALPAISTDIAADAASDTKTASPKAVKTFVEGKGYQTASQVQTKINDTIEDGIDYAFIVNTPTIPTVPAISTDIAADAASDTKTASPKAVKTFVEGKGYQTAANVRAALGGLTFRKAYSAYPTTPQDGDIVCIDGAYDVYHTGDAWEPMTPDPDTVYFIVDPPSGS